MPRDHLFYLGEKQCFAKDVVLRFGERGEVLGPAKYKRMRGTGLAMYFPGKDCIIDCYISQVRAGPLLSLAHTSFSCGRCAVESFSAVTNPT